MLGVIAWVEREHTHGERAHTLQQAHTHHLGCTHIATRRTHVARYTHSVTHTPITSDTGSLKPLTEANLPGDGFNVIDQPGRFDDGGVNDLQLILDIRDHALRRQKGDHEYMKLLNGDNLPKARVGQIQELSRSDQKAKVGG